ncbi:uncharacterized protein N7458_007196 [Penicillium daleae]|uniref:Uncharacterized protein n=1 Tax=Penicillium daleae TaxID=63821 RepID=A0AAD6G2E4_9EURO|nr:uncharacterized protein N7458_007196 [Penicillium daleae]KAJ5450747.1 hypothetical protein N7458_007196 [Penicillium daleae]
MSSNASTAGSMDESKFLKRNRALHGTRLGLSLMITSVAVSVIACEAQLLQHYNATAQWATSGLALWPLNLDLRPAIAALACGCVITVLNLVYVVVALLPSPHSRIKLLNSYASASAFSGFITSLVGIIFVIYRPSASYPSGFSQGETLHSWTCKWKSSNGSTSTPIHFTRDCHETRAGFALLCVLLGLEILMGLAAAAGTLSQRDVSRRRDQQVQLEKLEISAKQAYRP